VTAYQSLILDTGKSFYALFPTAEPYIRPSSTWRKLEKLEKLVYDLIDERRREGVGENTDLLSRMLRANMGDDHDKGLTDKELRVCFGSFYRNC
jgi:cytochrome P450